MQIKALVGAGDRIAAFTLPFAAAGLAANILWPSLFRIGSDGEAEIVGIVLLVVGVPLWLTSAFQILVFVPKSQLITTGPFALMRHPLYTSVALLVIPGLGLLCGSWLGLAIGGVFYVWARRFARREERDLTTRFPEYGAYRTRVLLPWL